MAKSVILKSCERFTLTTKASLFCYFTNDKANKYVPWRLNWNARQFECTFIATDNKELQ